LKKIIFIPLCLFLAVSCIKKKIPADDSLLGLDYYPTEQGKFVIYDVDSTVYIDLPVDTIVYKYRVKEKLADSYTDNEGNPAIRLERYIKMYDPNKSYDSIPWTVKEVWMINANKKSIQILERSVRYTKLIFPIQEKATWDGNAKNTIGEWDYTYDYIDKKETINNVSLDKVLLVKQKDLRTQISLERYSEKYAKGMGLVYREIIDVKNADVVNSQPVENRIKTGLIYHQTIVASGHE
jgi:hypothetical protein